MEEVNPDFIQGNPIILEAIKSVPNLLTGL